MPITISFGRLLSNPIGSLDELMERTASAVDIQEECDNAIFKAGNVISGSITRVVYFECASSVEFVSHSVPPNFPVKTNHNPPFVCCLSLTIEIIVYP